MSSWRQFNPNPSGRNVGDCAVRALSAALDVDWETAFAMTVKNAFLMDDIQNSNTVIGSILRQHGFRRSVIPNSCPDCYTIEDFAIEHPKGTFVVGTGNHVVCVRDGMIMDSWDSSREVPIFYWWRKDDGTL